MNCEHASDQYQPCEICHNTQVIKTPVRYNPTNGDIEDVNGYVLCTIELENDVQEVEDQIGREIVNAFNNHAALVEENTRLREALESVADIIRGAEIIKFETGNYYRQNEFGWEFSDQTSASTERDLEILQALSEPELDEGLAEFARVMEAV